MSEPFSSGMALQFIQLTFLLHYTTSQEDQKDPLGYSHLLGNQTIDIHINAYDTKTYKRTLCIQHYVFTDKGPSCMQSLQHITCVTIWKLTFTFCLVKPLNRS